jgi:hypothetical protein
MSSWTKWSSFRLWVFKYKSWELQSSLLSSTKSENRQVQSASSSATPLQDTLTSFRDGMLMEKIEAVKVRIEIGAF